MKQMKTMGYSALLLILLSLTSTNGFLETNRNNVRERNTDTRKNDFNDRNFFGSTWQRSYGTSDERRLINDRLFRSLPQEESRQGDERRISDARDDRVMIRNKRFLSGRENDRESRFGNSIDTRVSGERRDGRVIRLDRTRVDVLNDIRREIRSIRENDLRQTRDRLSGSDVREDERESRQRNKFDDRQEARNVEHDRRASTTKDNERESRQRLVRESRQLDRSTSLNRNVDNDRESRQLNRRILTQRREVRESRFNDRDSRQLSRRDDRNIDSAHRQIHTIRENTDRQLNRRVMTERREVRKNDRQLNGRDVRSVSSDRSRFVDNERRLSESLGDRRREVRSSPSREESRRMERRDVDESRNMLESRQLSGRREIRSTSRRENDLESRQLESDRRREIRQLTRREIRSIPEISRTTDRQVSDKRREDERMSRQVDNDRRREVRSISLDRNVRDRRASLSREEFRESRQMERRDVDRSRNMLLTRRFSNTLDDRRREFRSTPRRESDRRRETRQLARREVRSISDRSRTVDEIRREVSDERREDERMSRQLDDRRREGRSFSLDRRASLSREELRESREFDRSRDSGRVLSDRRDRSTLVDSDRRREVRSLSSDRVSDLRDIRVLERRLTREDDRRTSDATRRILTLSSKDENNNKFARTDKRQSTPAERRMATSFKTNVSYIPEIKSSAIFNAVQLVLLSLLVAQVVSNTSKTKKNWFFEKNFVTVTKEKVL